MNLDYPATSIMASKSAAPQDISVRLQFAKPLDDMSAQYWPAILGEIAAVTNAGGFAGASLPPALGAMLMKQVQRIGADGLALDFAVKGVDFGFFRVLYNCLASAHIYNATLASLDIQTRAGSDVVIMGTDDVRRVPYPGVPADLPFVLEREANPSSYSVTIEIDAPGGSEALGAPFARALTAWGMLLLGGYPEGDQHPYTCVSDCQEAQWTGDGVLFELPSFMGSESAFDAVIAMACRAAQAGLPVTRLSIE